MSDKKYVVPDGMLMAARKRWPESATGETVIRDRIEAALRWLSENPIVPTDEQAIELLKLGGLYGNPSLTNLRQLREITGGFQRIIFLDPQPEVPEEIKDLLDKWPTSVPCNEAHRCILEAYRRGKAGK